MRMNSVNSRFISEYDFGKPFSNYKVESKTQ